MSPNSVILNKSQSGNLQFVAANNQVIINFLGGILVFSSLNARLTELTSKLNQKDTELDQEVDEIIEADLCP